jgi:hypothetical protein
MSRTTVLSLTQLKRLTAFIDGQDGSQTQKQLLPLMCGALSIRGGLPPTEDSVAEAVQAIQLRVRHRHDKQRKREAEEARTAAMEAQAANTRSRRRNAAPAPDFTISVSRRRKSAQRVEATPQIRAEDKLYTALAELRVRNVQHTAEQRAAAIEERKARAESKKAERKERKAKEAEEQQEKRERTAKQRADERELKEKIRDQRALQSLTAAARQRLYEQAQMAALERAERIDNKMEHLIDLQTERLEGKRGRKRGREAAPDESEEDKENVEPEGEWQV